jgi:thimet oligopeptidase
VNPATRSRFATRALAPRPALLVAALLVATAFLTRPAAAGDTVGPAFFANNPDTKAFRKSTSAQLTRAQKALDKMLGVKGTRTIENTLQPYNEVMTYAEDAAYESNLMSEVHPDSAYRAVAEDVTREASKFLDALSLNQAAYAALKAVDVSQADSATQYFVMRTLRDFRRSGVDKDDATRKLIAALQDTLVVTSQAFGRNIRDDSRTITVDGSQALDGLPQDFIDSHKPGSDGKITLSIEYPDYFPVLRYAKDSDVRFRLMFQALNRAYPANMPVLDSLLAQRYRLAQMLGYPDWATYITEDKMIGNPQNASDFIARLGRTTKARAQNEYAVYLKRKQEDDASATQVNRWEMAYYGRLIRMRDYDYDPQQARNYFPFDRVKQGVLDVTAKMFGLTYKRITNAKVWDPAVEAYEVWEGKRFLGRFFLDLHPRPGKFNHAAKFTIHQGVAGIQKPEHALVCNFPGGKPDDPGLMEHSDVQTFFHEFGHLLHAILGGQGRWEPVSGTATERDFVEAPSQMLEEWCWNPGVLATFARNYQTGEPIPAELVQKMRRADAFGRALGIATQAYYSAVSLDLYDRPPAEVNSDQVVSSLEPDFTPVPRMKDTHFQTAFGHLDGYSAVYYTYMWSLVISKDMFSAFDPNDLTNPTVATRYRDTVLAPGGTKPAASMVHDFLGRDYDFTAFDTWLAEGGQP